jgi:hypothetical protein
MYVGQEVKLIQRGKPIREVVIVGFWAKQVHVEHENGDCEWVKKSDLKPERP